MILEEPHKLGKHHTACLRKLDEREEYADQQINKINTKAKIGHPVMVKNHACHTFQLKDLLDYKILKVNNHSTLLLLIPGGKERKTNINDI